MLQVVLYHPAIPQNTGNIARTTVGFGAHLHLIHPMKFEISDHTVQRAGLDYWPSVTLTEHENEDAFLAWLQRHQEACGAAVWLITKFGDLRFDRATYGPDDVLILPGNIAAEGMGQRADLRTTGTQFVTAVPELRVQERPRTGNTSLQKETRWPEAREAAMPCLGGDKHR